MEALSDLLRLMRLEVSIYHNAKLCGDWVVNEHILGQTCFHMATEGDCILEVDGHGSHHLNRGDLVIFPSELPHTMRPSADQEGSQQHLPYDTELTGTGMLCGRVQFQHRGSDELLNALPPLVIVPLSDETPWLTSLLGLILKESYQQGPAANAILDKLSEILFTYALRYQLSQRPQEAGVLALYAHSKLASVVSCIHADPAREWTLESLAKIANQSRSSFAKTWRNTGGWTAMQYVTWWRMQLAWSELQSGESIANAAERVGYKSEAAFARAFQKHFGTSAGKVRRKARG